MFSSLLNPKTALEKQAQELAELNAYFAKELELANAKQAQIQKTNQDRLDNLKAQAAAIKAGDWKPGKPQTPASKEGEATNAFGVGIAKKTKGGEALWIGNNIPNTDPSPDAPKSVVSKPKPKTKKIITTGSVLGDVKIYLTDEQYTAHLAQEAKNKNQAIELQAVSESKEKATQTPAEISLAPANTADTKSDAMAPSANAAGLKADATSAVTATATTDIKIEPATGLKIDVSSVPALKAADIKIEITPTPKTAAASTTATLNKAAQRKTSDQDFDEILADRTHSNKLVYDRLNAILPGSAPSPKVVDYSEQLEKRAKDLEVLNQQIQASARATQASMAPYRARAVMAADAESLARNISMTVAKVADFVKKPVPAAKANDVDQKALHQKALSHAEQIKKQQEQLNANIKLIQEKLSADKVKALAGRLQSDLEALAKLKVTMENKQLSEKLNAAAFNNTQKLASRVDATRKLEDRFTIVEQVKATQALAEKAASEEYTPEEAQKRAQDRVDEIVKKKTALAQQQAELAKQKAELAPQKLDDAKQARALADTRSKNNLPWFQQTEQARTDRDRSLNNHTQYLLAADKLNALFSKGHKKSISIQTQIQAQPDDKVPATPASSPALTRASSGK